MAKALNKRNDVEVDYLFSGREKSKYFDMEVFGQFQTRHGLTFSTSNGSINRWGTFRSAKILSFLNDIKNLELGSYDLLINDFEPVSAWAAKRQGIPSISISHQASFLHPIPRQEESFVDRLITEYFAPTEMQLGVHWYHFGHTIVPPFIEDQALNISNDKSLLVYLPFEDLEDIETLLAPLAEYDFVCFHPGIKQHNSQANIVWCPPSKDGFHRSLLSCDGVIANAGFELSSECLQYGKRLLLKPLEGQFEQLSNAQTLTRLGLCQSMPSLSPDIIEKWVTSAPNESIVFPADPNILIDWLLKKDWDSAEELCATLWQTVQYPVSVLNKFNQMTAR
jgi:uncharacterized protein (TIGR00661 family)